MLTEAHTPQIAKLIYAVSEGHLEVAIKVLSLDISQVESYNSLAAFNSDKSDYLRLLLEKRLSALGATGGQIDDVLKFGALLGLSFTYLELEIITQYGQAKLRTIIENAQRMALVDESKCVCQFSHDIIREFFRQKALSTNRGYYYDRLISCYKALYPTEYNLRIKYLLASGNIKEVEKLYTLEIIAQMETRNIKRSADIEILLSDEIKHYIENMNTAWILYHKSEFRAVTHNLQLIEDIYPLELLAERDYLSALATTRTLKPIDCDTALHILSSYEDSESKFSEPQIWSKTMLLLLAAHLHAENRNDCERVQKKLYEFYSQKAPISKCYRRDLNVLRRKSIAIFELEISLIHMKESVEFFQPEDEQSYPLYPCEYLMSLANYSAGLLCMGLFQCAYDTIYKAAMLTID